jgi:hypothetical protein
MRFDPCRRRAARPGAVVRPALRKRRVINGSCGSQPTFSVEAPTAAPSLMRRFDEFQLPLHSCRWAQMSGWQQRVGSSSSRLFDAVIRKRHAWQFDRRLSMSGFSVDLPSNSEGLRWQLWVTADIQWPIPCVSNQPEPPDISFTR